MRRNQYFVEGQCERALLKAFMFLDETCFIDGRVEVFNFKLKRMSNAYARSIKKGTHVCIILDSDTEPTKIIDENIAVLKKIAGLKDEEITFCFATKTFEDEIVFACNNIKNVNQVFNTQGIDEFKNKFISHKDLLSKLKEIGFDIEKIWSRDPKPPFDVYQKYRRSIVKKW